LFTLSSFFLSPEDRECILKLGLGTHVQYKKPSIVSWYDFPEVPHNRSYYRFRNVLPIQVVHASNENSAEYNTHEEKSGGSDISTLSGLLDDAVEVQVFQLLSTSSTQTFFYI
jgi:hypothetical protein